MIEAQPIQLFAPEVLNEKDPTAGYFIAVKLDAFSEESLVASTVYSRKDFYKISLVTGHSSFTAMKYPAVGSFSFRTSGAKTC